MIAEENLLIKKAKDGNMKAFEELIYRYDKKVLAIAASYRNNSEDAKDIYQEVFIRVYKGLKNFEGKSEFSTWLFRITANVCLTFRNSKKRYEHISIDREFESEEGNSMSLAETIQDDNFADQKLINDEFSYRMQEAINTLSDRQKMVFTLKYLNEFKIKEIAEMMNCTEGTIKKYLFTATNKMKDKLKIILEI